jgi:hypothetical protein
METLDFVKVLAKAFRTAGAELVGLDRGDDSYPLTIMKPSCVATARQLERVSQSVFCFSRLAGLRAQSA